MKRIFVINFLDYFLLIISDTIMTSLRGKRANKRINHKNLTSDHKISQTSESIIH